MGEVMRVRQTPVSGFFNPDFDEFLTDDEKASKTLDALTHLTEIPEPLRRAAYEYFGAREEVDRNPRSPRVVDLNRLRGELEEQIMCLSALPAVPHLILFLEAGYAANVSPITGLLSCFKLVVPVPTVASLVAPGREVRNGHAQA